MKLAVKTILIGIMVFTVSCVTEIEPETVPTELAISVTDDQQEFLGGVSVYLFDNELDYNKAKQTGNVVNRIKEGVTSVSDTTALVFSNLNHNIPYFIYVTHRDRRRFVDLNNFSDGFDLPKGFLSKSGKTSIRIDLQQAKSAVSFYSQSSTNDQFPISVFLGNDSIGIIESNTGGIPSSLNDPSALAYKIGVSQSWYATSSRGCIWAGEIAVDGTESFETIPLDDCDAGAITFWTPDSNLNRLPINISLNGLDNVGDLQVTGEATKCFGSKGLSLGRSPGIYQYTASSGSSSCSWSGQVTVVSGGCSIIELENCE